MQPNGGAFTFAVSSGVVRTGAITGPGGVKVVTSSDLTATLITGVFAVQTTRPLELQGSGTLRWAIPAGSGVPRPVEVSAVRLLIAGNSLNAAQLRVMNGAHVASTTAGLNVTSAAQCQFSGSGTNMLNVTGHGWIQCAGISAPAASARFQFYTDGGAQLGAWSGKAAAYQLVLLRTAGPTDYWLDSSAAAFGAGMSSISVVTAGGAALRWIHAGTFGPALTVA